MLRHIGLVVASALLSLGLRESSTKLVRIGLAVLALLASAADLTQAGTITLYDSFDSGSNGIYGLISAGTFAESFSTGSSAVDLTEIQVALQVAGNPSTMTQSISVDLLSDSATSPGALLMMLGTIPDNSLSIGGGGPIVTLATPFSLTPNTRYWIELSAPPETGNVGAGWDVSFEPGIGVAIGVAGEFLDINGNVGPTTSGGRAYYGSYLMELTAQPHVNSAAVPEPSSLFIFAGLGTISLVGAFYPRRKKARVLP